MAINLVVAVTDGDWFELLRQEPDLDEVNFWAPSGKLVGKLEPGELFLFKLHAPKNVIVGGGIYAHASLMPCSLAWQAFGVANGARSIQEMRGRIAKYRQSDPADRSDFPIGCRILTQPFFFEEWQWMPPPPSWKPQIVNVKRYSTDNAEGLKLWEDVRERMAQATSPTMAEEGHRYGVPHLIQPRLGQGAFRTLVTDIYDRRCAITQEKTLPALEAAHIRPYADGGAHEASNGLLFRRDIHSLFDSGYVTVTPDLRFEVSRRIREEFDNGRHYYALHGQEVATPTAPNERPDALALAWHNEERFLG